MTATEPTVHWQRKGRSFRGAITECGRKSGETTDKPWLVTCKSEACSNRRVAFEREQQRALRTSSVHEAAYRSKYETDEQRERLDRQQATLDIPWDGIATVASALGTYSMVDEADASDLAGAFEALRHAAQAAAATFAARRKHPDIRP